MPLNKDSVLIALQYKWEEIREGEDREELEAPSENWVQSQRGSQEARRRISLPDRPYYCQRMLVLPYRPYHCQIDIFIDREC